MGQLEQPEVTVELMPLATTLGIDSVNMPMVAATTLQLNGNSITLSNALWLEIEEVAPEFVGEHRAKGAVLDARALTAVFRRRAELGTTLLTLASVFTMSSRNHLLRLLPSRIAGGAACRAS